MPNGTREAAIDNGSWYFVACVFKGEGSGVFWGANDLVGVLGEGALRRENDDRTIEVVGGVGGSTHVLSSI